MKAIIFSYPDHKATIPLMRWLTETHRISWGDIISVRGHGGGRLIDASYNLGVITALESDADEFLFCDNDIFPSPEKTDIFMRERKFDLQCVKCPTECGDAFATPESFHSLMWRASRSTFEKIGLPLFKWKMSADGTKSVGCPCSELAKRARRCGLSTGHIGEAFHVPRMKDGLPSVIKIP